MSAASDDALGVERLGGLAGFGLPGSRLRSRGRVRISRLSETDRRALDALFGETPPPPRGTDLPDAFRYRLTRSIAGSLQTIEVTEGHLPAAVLDCVKDELA